MLLNHASLTIDSSKFSHNAAQANSGDSETSEWYFRGGVMFAINGSSSYYINIIHSTFTRNMAYYGGVLYAEDTLILSVISNNFDNNIATQGRV